MRDPYVGLAVAWSAGAVAVQIWRLSSLLIALHGRDRVARASPFGRLLAVSRSQAPRNRRALLASALILPVFPLGFAFVNQDLAALICLVAAAVCCAVSLVALAIDRTLRHDSPGED